MDHAEVESKMMKCVGLLSAQQAFAGVSLEVFDKVAIREGFLTFTFTIQRPPQTIAVGVGKSAALDKDESGKTLYGVQSVLAVRDSLLKRASRRDKLPEVITDWLQPTDIPASLALDQIVYHEMFLAEAEVYMAWRRKNPHISMAAFDARDRRICYAYIGLIPLPEAVILDVLTGKKDEKEITPDEILSNDQPGEYTVLANSAVVHPDYPELISKVIEAITNYWLSQYPERRIKRIYAQAVSEQGRKIAQKLYLGPLYLLQNQEMVRVANAFVLDLNDTAASRIIREFQERLKAKAEQSQKKPE